MPTFDYKCMKCDSVVEMHISSSATDTIYCTSCQGVMTKKYTPPAVIFRGGGWGGQ